MVLESLSSFFIDNLGSIARYILVPLEVALLVFIAAEFYSRRSGVTLAEEFHKKSFAVSAAVVFGWLIYMLIPGGKYALPQEDITLKTIFGLFMLILTVQYFFYLGVELFSKRKTVIALGLGSGLIRSTLAVAVMAPQAAEDESATIPAATAIMLANAVAALRNFAIIAIVSSWLGILGRMPIYFTYAMLAMFATSLAIAVALYFKGGRDMDSIEFKPFSVKAPFLFTVAFVLIYYITVLVIRNGGMTGFFVLSGLAGFVYGAAHLFTVASLLFLKRITVEAAYFAAVLVTLGTMISDIPYAFVFQAKKLGKYLIILELIPLAAGLIVLYFFF